jgi:hypothetical protein
MCVDIFGGYPNSTLLLERLPPTEEFTKNFTVEVLGYLLSPFFDDNDELLGIEIIDFSPFYFFSFFFFFLQRISYLLLRIQ